MIMTEHTYDPLTLCSCGTSIHDNDETRTAHENEWHSRKYPATYTKESGDHA